MGIVVKGMEQLTASLYNFADKTSDLQRAVLKKGAEDIRDLARLYVPVDTKNLEKSIKIPDEQRQSVFLPTGRKRNKYTVEVDDEMPSPSPSHPNGKIGDYSWIIHEDYDRRYGVNPGENTKAKMEANPMIHIGSKFLERALEELAPEINEKAKAAGNRRLGH